jgi:hypothetical protein
MVAASLAFRWMRVISKGISLPDPTVATVDINLGLLILRNLGCGFYRIGLSTVRARGLR